MSEKKLAWPDLSSCLCSLRAFLFSRAFRDFLFSCVLRAFTFYMPSVLYVHYVPLFYYVSYIFYSVSNFLLHALWDCYKKHDSL